MPVQRYNSDLAEMLRPIFQGRKEPNFAASRAVSTLTALPVLIGAWPMTNAQDYSGQSRNLTSTNVMYGYDNLVPITDFNGTSAVLTRADETALDITGTESYVLAGQKGLTMGGWFNFDALGTNVGLMGKYLTTGNQRSYLLWKSNSNVIVAAMSGNGTAVFSANWAGAVPVAGNWYHIILQYSPSTFLRVWVNGEYTANTTSIPASIYSSTANFYIGDWDGAGLFLNGKTSMCFLSACCFPDVTIRNLYHVQRSAFRVS